MADCSFTGDVLVDGGFILHQDLECAPEQLEQANEVLGKKLVRFGAIVAVLSMACLPAHEVTHAASSSTKIILTATVPARTQVRVLYQVPSITITGMDILRGWVDVQAASRIEVVNNSRAGYLLLFEGMKKPFKEAYVRGLGKEIQIGAGGGWIPQAYHGKGVVTSVLSYRFVLSDEAEPGTYSWPFSISASPM